MLTVLERDVYTVPQAARLLGLAPSTFSYWLEGGVRRGRTYRPILRREPTGKKDVTWAEFVEAGMLAQYRRTLSVPMAEIRAFVDSLRDELGVPYPLADRRPFVLNRKLVFEVQNSLKLAADWCLVAEARSGQYVLTPASEAFLQRVEWSGNVAAAWRPAADLDSPVRLDPESRFGRPSVKGISTASIWEQIDGGEDIAETAELLSLTVSDVRWALAYEEAQRARGTHAA